MAEFKFSLAPSKSKDQKEHERKRDNINIYFSLLPFLGVIIWLVLLMLNALYLNETKVEAQGVVSQKQEMIDTKYQSILSEHGELVIKTKALATLIQKDIDPEIVFIVAEQVFPSNDATISVVGYGRNDDGSFSISLIADDYQKIARTTRRLKNLDITKDVNIDSSVYINGIKRVQSTINFNINIEEIE